MRPTRHSALTRSAFTLIELLIVIAVILILVSVLILAVLPALQKGDDAKTTELFISVEEAITKWRQGEGKANNSYPKSGKNNTKRPYDGNLLLYKQLVRDPQKKNRDPYLEVDEEMVGYLSEDGKSFSLSGDASRAILLDGHGQPIVYWEWASKTKRTASNDPTEGNVGSRASKSELALAKNKGSYDVYSAGADTQLGTADDLGAGGETVTDSPFAKSSSSSGKDNDRP